LCGPEFYYIDVDTVHGWAAQYLEGPRVDFRRAEECLEEALATVRREHPDARILQRPVSFFQEEISQVIRGRLLADLPSYQELQRRGRGTPLNSEQRTMVWKVFEEYVRLRSRNHVLDADDLLQGALYRLMGPKGSGVRGQIDAELFAQQGPAREGHNYLAVLVDEAQDLTELGLHLVYAIAGDRPNGLFLVGDGLQKIYKGGFSLRRFGIDIHGRALVLKKNFRNTRAIMAAAYALVSELEFEDFDEEAKTKAYPPEFSARTGEKPIIAKCRDIEHEATWIAKTIQDLRDRVGVRAGDIAVLYRGEPYRAAVAGALEKAGIEHVFHREDHFLDEDAVRVSTVHSTKGMEFRAVLIAGLTERIFPWAGIDPQTATEEEKRAHIELQLRLLYVAMTRARDFLFLTYPMLDRNSNVLQPSWFLNRIRDFCMFHDAVSQPAFA
jgi:superfamily I DNA/RNA helicase